MPFAIPERSKIGIGSSTEGISRWNEKNMESSGTVCANLSGTAVSDSAAGTDTADGRRLCAVREVLSDRCIEYSMQLCRLSGDLAPFRKGRNQFSLGLCHRKSDGIFNQCGVVWCE